MSPPIWDLLELAPQDYPRGLWEWHKGIVHFRGGRYTLAQRGYFIRRYELDDFLLRRSKAPVVEGHHVKKIERASDGSWVIDGQFQAIDGICAHQGGPLAKGQLVEGIVTCPWHGWQFQVANGQHCLNPRICQTTFEVKIEAGDVFVRV